MASQRNWADIHDDEDFANNEELEEVRPDGTKEKVKYFVSEATGGNVKVTRIVREHRKETRFNTAIFERRRLTHLSASPAEEELQACSGCQWDEGDYSFEIPKGALGFHDDCTAADLVMASPDNAVSIRPDLKKKFAILTKGLTAAAPAKIEVASTPADPAKPSEEKYAAPWKRNRDAGLPSRMDDRRDECTVRVTNLSEDVKEKDLKELFGPIGKIQRIYLAMHKETNSSKGFAFITYDRPEHAKQAIANLNRHGYNNLLLTVENAKQSNRPPREGRPATAPEGRTGGA